MGEPEDFIAHCVHLGRVEVDALRATLAARDERVRELGEELVEREAVCDMWRSSVSEGIEERDRLRSRVRELDAEVSAWRSWNAPVLDAKPAPAEEPREVVEPKSAVGLAVEELRRREVVEPAPAPAQMFVCLKCGWVGPQSDTYTYPAPNSARYHMGCQYAVLPVGEAGS